jgi:hypothetical protein
VSSVALLTAAAQRDLTSGHDQAAVIDSRVEAIGLIPAGGAAAVAAGNSQPACSGPQLGTIPARPSRLVAELADQVRVNATAETPAWAAQSQLPMPAELITDLHVWCAATHVDPSDLRPTGPPPARPRTPEYGNSN